MEERKRKAVWGRQEEEIINRELPSEISSGQADACQTRVAFYKKCSWAHGRREIEEIGWN